MNEAERYHRASELFDEVCDLAPEPRAQRLRELCGEDGELRREVESLLAHDGGRHGLVEAGEAGCAVDALAAELLPEGEGELPAAIGGYRVVRRIGAGGMGLIYEAQQESPARRVAIKVLRPGLAGGDVLRRFRREAHVLGQLQHPGIAQIYELGVSEPPASQPFLVMELVDGTPLTGYAAKHDLDHRQRVELMARTCDAVQHAHRRGFIHRDLKPGNVLVVAGEAGADGAVTASRSLRDTSSGVFRDAIGQPKVLDFGIARITDTDSTLATIQTESGQIIGTLAYMSPEQVEGMPDDLDTRCDVYALGVMTYELLCGVLPLDVRGRTLAEAARIIREEEPVRLGTRRRRLRGDLEAIVAKALEKNRRHRYGAAADLAADLRRWLDDLPIEARPMTAVYQLRKFVRRHRGLVAGTGIAVVALVTALVLSVTALREARTDRDLAREAEQRARRVASFQETVLERIDVAEMGRALGAQLDAEMGAGRAALIAAGDLTAAGYDALLHSVNPTNLARSALDGSVLKQAVDLAESNFGDDPVAHGRILDSLAETYHNLGLSDPALALAKRALDLRLRYLQDDHPDVARAYGNLGAVYLDRGDGEKALSCFGQALRRREAERDGDPFLLLEARLRLADAAIAVRDFDRAETLLVRSIAALRDLDPDDRKLFGALNSLARLYLRTDRAAEAVPLLEESLAGRRRVLGDRHPQTLSSLNNIAGALSKLGRLDEAERRYRELVPQLRAAVGDDDPRTCLVLGNLADVLIRRGETAAAAKILRPLLERQRRTLGPEHPRTKRTAQRLASLPQ